MKNGVDIWRYSLDVADEKATQITSVLSDEEIAAAAHIRDRVTRRRIRVARGIVRSTLARYLDADPEALEFARGPWGKPELARGCAGSLRFNTSRSGGLGILAVAFGREVGVDIERLDARRAFGPIAEQLFAEAEVEELRNLSVERRVRRFSERWTRKEAYAKALGIGLTAPLLRLDVSRDRLPGGWFLHRLPEGIGHVATLCIEGARARVRMLDLDAT